jgi:hypothetical protein
MKQALGFLALLWALLALGQLATAIQCGWDSHCITISE